MAGKRYYTCNYNYFDRIETEEQAYWLGFIYADGCVMQHTRKRILKTQITMQKRSILQITLAAADAPHIQKFLDAMGSNHPINLYPASATVKISARVIIEDEHLVTTLIDKGVLPNKSLVLKPPALEQLPEELELPFIRGYFDGNGCLSSHRARPGADSISYEFNITSTREMLEWIIPRLSLNPDNGWSQRFPERKNNNWTKRGSGNRQSERVMNLLYQNASVYLERKYIKYQELVQYNSRP